MASIQLTRRRRRLDLLSHSVGGGGVAPIDAAIVTYAANVTSAGGTITAPQQTALSAAVAAMKAASIWTKVVEWGPFLGGTVGSSTSGCAVKIKAPVSLTGTLNAFVGADLTAKGLKSNGSTKWFNPLSTNAQLNASGAGMGMWVYLTEEVTQPGFGQFMGTTAGGDPQVTLRWQAVANGVDGQLGGLGAAAPTTTYSRALIGVGLLGIQRTGSAITHYLGGYQTGQVSSSPTWVANGDVHGVFAGNGGSSAIAMTCGSYLYTDGTMTDADCLSLATILNTLMAALGRAAPAARPFNVRWLYGQSVAAGTGGTPVVSTSQAYGNLMMTSGVLSGNTNSSMPGYINALGQGAKIGSMSALVENGTETIASGAANTIAMLARADGLAAIHDTAVVNTALGATAYSGLAKGTNPYANAFVAFGGMKTSAPLYATGGLFFVSNWMLHGESDMLNASYDLNIRQLQVDAETDQKALSGQSGTIPMLHSQPACWTSTNNVNSAQGLAPQLILNESRANPTKTYCVGPRYQFVHNQDGVHPGSGTVMGAISSLYAKFDYRIIRGQNPQPLTIASVVRSGAVLTVTLQGGIGNAVTDTTTVTDPSGNNTLGFEWTDSATLAANRYTAISSVVLTNAATRVYTITLAVNPTGNTGMFLSYAWTGTPGASAGPTTGPRGCIRDSDTFVDVFGNTSRNHLCIERVAVT